MQRRIILLTQATICYTHVGPINGPTFRRWHFSKSETMHCAGTAGHWL